MNYRVTVSGSNAKSEWEEVLYTTDQPPQSTIRGLLTGSDAVILLDHRGHLYGFDPKSVETVVVESVRED